MKFIDLYAGIGGFRYALESQNHKCVFSAEIDNQAIRTYMHNFKGSSPYFDLNLIADLSHEEIDNIIPDHEILAAGFPCQPFSVGGKKKGFEDTRGTQFFNILKILEVKQPRYIILENVKNITTHDDGNTYKVIKSSLEELGYNIQADPYVLSPMDFGIPQNRDRAFFFAELNKPIVHIPKPKPMKQKTILENDVSDQYNISKERLKALKAWEHFMKNVKTINGKKIPDFWVKDIMEGRKAEESDPLWKQKYYDNMHEFYDLNKTFIDKWYKKWNVKDFPKIESKFEWRAGKEPLTLENKILMFRTSGVRIMKPDKFPTLVARAQMSVIKDGDRFRYITPRESANLQSFPIDHKIIVKDAFAYKQFGNSVNVDVIKYIVKNLIK